MKSCLISRSIQKFKKHYTTKFKIKSMVSAIEKPRASLKRDYAHDSESAIQREQECGISAYISEPLQNWSGLLKERYGDFIVCEISADGHVARMTNTDSAALDDFFKPPVLPKEMELSESQKKDKLRALVGANECEQVFAMLNATDISRVVCPAVNTKNERTVAHLFIKQHFSEMLESSTDDSGSLVIQRKVARQRPDSRSVSWKEKGVSCCQFILFKENRDTMDAISYISRNTKVPVKVFSYAGTKDKRASTTQFVTAFKTYAERLARFNKQPYAGIMLGDFKYVKEPLKLGDLKGNQFTICIRQVQSQGRSEDQLRADISQQLSQLKQRGFINYFGLQRFGTREVKTSQVGAALLNSDWRRATDMILNKAGTAANDCYTVWKATGNAKEALKLVSHKSMAERSLLQHLAKDGCETDFATAVALIPRNMRTMYVRAFQSYIWNSVASERVKLYGATRVVVGDLVLVADGVLDENSDLSAMPDKKNLAKVVQTEEEANQFSIYDVVLPLPGFDVHYPDNELYKVYKRLLSDADIDIDHMKRSIRDYSLPGAYRKLLGKPDDLEWQFKTYADPDEPLVETERARLLKTEELQSNTEKTYLALILQFSLKTSQYATMLLREVSKGSVTQSFSLNLAKKVKTETGTVANTELNDTLRGTDEIGIDI